METVNPKIDVQVASNTVNIQLDVETVNPTIDVQVASKK